MVQTSKPWNNTGPGDAGPYSAEQWALMYRVFFNGVLTGQDNKGVLVKSGDGTNSPLKVAVTSPNTAQVKVYPGEALVNGRHYISDAQELITIAANVNPNPRIDRIILRQVFANQQIRLAVLQGTAAASPVAPALTQNRTGTFEISLAQVLVPSGFSTITGDITDERQAALLLPVEYGGLGLDLLVGNTLAKGKIPAGTSDSAYAHTPAMPNFGMFVGDSSQATGIGVVSQRPHKLQGPETSSWAVVRPANSVNGTIIPFKTSKLVNPDGYITSLAANVWTMSPGTYIVNAAVNIGNESASSNLACQYWLSNDAVSTSIANALARSLQGQVSNINPDASGVVTEMSMLDELVTLTGTETLTLRFRSFSATGATNLSLDGSVEFQYMISFKKIQ